MTKKSLFLLVVFFCNNCNTSEIKTSTSTITQEAIIQSAKANSKNGEWLQAAKLYEESYLNDPSKEELNYEAGTNYLRANYPHKALLILNKFDKKHQDISVAFNGRIARIAKAYYLLGAYEKIPNLVENYSYPKMYRGLAREHLKALIQLQKTNDLSAYFTTYQQGGIYDDKGKKTNLGFLYRAICNELLILGNFEVLKLYAENYNNWAITRQAKDKRNLAFAVFYQQDFKQAIYSLKEAISVEKSPRHRMELEGMLGVSYAKEKEVNKAIAQIKKIQSLTDLPNRPDAFGAKYYHQARIEVALKQKENAIQSLRKALSNKAAFWSNRFKEDGLLRDLFGHIEFKELIK